VPVNSTIAQLWAKADRPGVRAFFLSIAALGVALLLALYSGAAAEVGHTALSIAAALMALLVAGWVAITLVPVLAKRTPLRWIGYKMEYKITREGWIYIGGIIVVALAALNTGNNLLFLILASLIAIILMSGVLSSITLSGIEMRLELPEHIFAGQAVRAQVELENEKLTLPSFSLRVEAATSKKSPAAALLETPVYFPYVPKRECVRQSVPITFALVYPSVEPSRDFFEILPALQGALESLSKGGGHDLYALRGYVPTDSARHVHWKASARSGTLMVREFTREDDCRVLLVLDPHVADPIGGMDEAASANASERFERAVTLCASIAWHFFERNAQLQFRSANLETSLATAEENIFAILRHLALAQPLPPDPRHELLSDLAASPDLFKVIVTSQPRGSIPATLWHSSYVVFLDDLGS
jgi:uncharacterized protein (DUF58 family)